MENPKITKLEYQILSICIVEEPFSIVVASGLLGEGYALDAIISAIVRLVELGYLQEVGHRAVSEKALLDHVRKRTDAGEDVWNEWPGVVEEYNFQTWDQGYLQLKEEDRPTLRFDALQGQTSKLSKQGLSGKVAQAQGLIESNEVLLALGITKEQLEELGLL